MPASSLTLERSATRVAAVPWYVWSTVVAVTSTTFGLYWDISWHTGIGRDTFWTPAHLAIQFGAVLTGLSCAYLILHTTFSADSAAKESSVRIWGFRGPLGAFIAAWGGFAMLTSAPFDNWWHDSFGLDIKILSPPHVLLFIGIITMGLGGLILIVGQMNRSSGEAKSKLNWLLLYVGSLLFCLLFMLVYEYLGDNTLMHSAIFYRVVGMIGPFGLIGIARASGHRWAATIVASFYTVLWLAGLCDLPFVSAEAQARSGTHADHAHDSARVPFAGVPRRRGLGLRPEPVFCPRQVCAGCNRGFGVFGGHAGGAVAIWQFSEFALGA